ncbi:MAG: DUF4974 domain-containing protein [Bacteroidia bacterium]|nr:DUF4974 domain-containing protein [Bacteroidia bacterium]
MDKDLLYRFFNQETTFEEEKLIRQWLEASEENRETLFKERKLFDALLLHAETSSLTQSRRHYKVLFRRAIIAVSSVAAVVLLAVTGTVRYMEQAMQKLPDNVITVPQGQRVSLRLADGTQVWLNAKTRMSYPQSFQSANKRMVSIDGEAYFEVSKDKKHPFVVQTKRGAIEVLGTKFYVSAYSRTDKFETSLIEGRVKVYTPSAELILRPNDKAVWKDGHLVRSKIDDTDLYRWRDGLYCFKNETFREVLKQFEVYYDVKFVYQNKQLSNPKINGKFRLVDGVDYALNILQKEVEFTYHRDEETNVIYIK